MSEHHAFPSDYLLELISVTALESGKMTEPENLEPSDENKRQVAAIELSSVIEALITDWKVPSPQWVIDVLRAIAEDSVFLVGICHYLYRRGWECDVSAFRNRHSDRVADRIGDCSRGLAAQLGPIYRDRLDYRPHYNTEGDLRWAVQDTETGFVVDYNILTPSLAVERLLEYPERP